MYTEITALAQTSGYAWATNSYFARIYDVAPQTVSRWISELVHAGFVTIDINEEAGNSRKIYINSLRPINKIVKTSTQKDQDPINKNVKYNNTSNNIKNKYYKGEGAAQPKTAGGGAEPQTTPDSSIASGSGYGLVEQPDRPQADERHVQWCRARALNHETRSFEEWLIGMGQA